MVTPSDKSFHFLVTAGRKDVRNWTVRRLFEFRRLYLDTLETGGVTNEDN